MAPSSNTRRNAPPDGTGPPETGARWVDYCTRGCTDRGRHGTDCTCGGDGHQHTQPTATQSGCDRCDGCQARSAVLGNLCQPDVGRVTRAVRDSPELIHWVRANIRPGTWRSGRDDVLREAPAPLNVTAVSDADDLAVLLAEWTIRHAVDSGLTGPWLGYLAIRAPATFRSSAGVEVTHPARVVGVRPGDEQVRAVYGIAAWTLTHLEGLAGRDDAGRWHDEIVDTVATLNARWPRTDRARKLPIPCPSCDRVMLWLHPPLLAPHYGEGGRVSAQEHTVVCHSDTCGRTLSEADYYWRAQQLLAERTGTPVPRRPVPAHA